ncbi:Gfo/Idh/MocA family protein [Thermodesulfobacteriota bacterium]
MVIKPLKIGIIGAGNIARQHLQVMQDIPWITAAGITSRTITKAERLAEEFRIPVCTGAVDDLLRNGDLDAVMILVSPDQMFAVASTVIPAGLPLFIEKPAGLFPEEHRHLADLAEKHHVATMVGLNRRYYSIFHKGLEVIRRHGQLLGVAIDGHERIWRIYEGAKFGQQVMDHWIFANGIHTIDLLRFFGGDIQNLEARASSLRESSGDQFAAVIQFADGAIGTYSAHWYSPGGWRVVLYGEGATVQFQPLEKGVWTDASFVSHDIAPDPEDEQHKPGFYRQMTAFGEMIRDRRLAWPGVDLKGAYESVKIAEKLIERVRSLETTAGDPPMSPELPFPAGGQ